MAWREDSVNTTEPKKTEEINWLKIPEPAAVGKTAELRVRILDEEPVGTWRHWLGNRPYNCPGYEKCPVCRVRSEAMKSDPDGYKNTYRIDYRSFLNVLHDDKVAVFSVTPTIERKLKVFTERYGDLRDYDISVMKRKTGTLKQNVEYDVIFEKQYALNDEQRAIAENRYDREQFVKPASREYLDQVAEGIEPTRENTAPVDEPKAKTAKATKADMIMLKTLAEHKGWTLGELGIVEASPPPKDVIVKLIKELEQEK